MQANAHWLPQSVGGAAGCPAELSCLAGSPGVEKRLDSGFHNPVVLSAPVKEKQRVGLG